MSVKGFKRYNAQGELDGVEKYDYNSLDNIPTDLVTAKEHGTEGQYAISDGKGGINWVTLENGDEVKY